MSRGTPSRRTRAACTPSSARIPGPRPSPGPGRWACWPPPRCGARPRAPADSRAGGPGGPPPAGSSPSWPARGEAVDEFAPGCSWSSTPVAVGGGWLFEGRVLPGPPDAVWSGPDRPDRVGGDDHLVRVVGGLDLLQAVIGGGREHRAGWGRGLLEVVGVVAGVPRGQGVLDRLGLRAHRGGQVGCGGGAGGEQQVAGVDAG